MNSETDILDDAGRQVLVNLVKGPSIDGTRQTQLWGHLVRQREPIERRLADLHLDLVLDHDQKIAFCRQKDDPDGQFPILFRRASLTYLQSALALYLRSELALADTRGERAVVSEQDVSDHLAVFRKPGDQDLSKFTKAVQGALDKFKSYNLIRSQEATPDRFEVSPTLKLVFPQDQIRALEQAYRDLALRTDEDEEDGE